MYNKIYVPVDNSEYSNQAVRKAVKIGSVFGSDMVGSHVYAATMHDYRFKQMEFTLPEEYLQEQEIERQRKIHDSLITLGLELISDCYLTEMKKECEQAGLPFEPKMMDGKHHVEILKDIEESDYDLVVLGVLGVGKTRDSLVGSVCDRVTRVADRDVLVVKKIQRDDEPEPDTILVGIDGSPQSFGGLMRAIDLAKKFDKKIELISVYDPYLHYAVFNSIVDVLTEQASKVFRFEEQNQLHEEVIDTGLAQIYQSHLNVAEQMVKEQGLEATKILLDGKAFQKILNHARKTNPWLLIIGRIGVHSSDEETSLGSNAENLLRLCPCDILLNTQLEFPELDLKAEESILWTEESEERMGRVPEAVRGIARTGILRLAIEQGHSVITNAVIDEAMDRFMPKGTAKATERLAEQLVLERSRQQNMALCKKCGTSAREANPVKCAVCGGEVFEVLNAETIEKIIAEEGGDDEETTYDGRKLSWSRDARKQLLAIEDQYQKRRAKARIEKAARMKRLNTITVDFAKAVIEDEVGKVLFETTIAEGQKQLELSSHDFESDKKLIAKDEKGAELYSVFPWAEEASSRLFQVPAGFMRERTQERAENLALERQLLSIDLALVEEALSLGKNLMTEFLVEEGLISNEQVKEVEKIASETGKCPFSSLFSGEKLDDVGSQTERIAEKISKINELQAQKQDRGEKGAECPIKDMPIPQGGGKSPESHVYTGAVEHQMNEIGVMNEMKKRRDRIDHKNRPTE